MAERKDKQVCQKNGRVLNRRKTKVKMKLREKNEKE